MKRKRILGIRLDDREHNKLKADADAMGLSISAYIRLTMLRKEGNSLKHNLGEGICYVKKDNR